jgi:hypothetical protein
MLLRLDTVRPDRRISSQLERCAARESPAQGWHQSNDSLRRARGASVVFVSASGNTAPLLSAPVSVDIDVPVGSATLACQVDRTKGVVTVSPQDLTTSAGLAALTAGLQAGAKVRVSAVPRSGGGLQADAITYFTGTLPPH